MASRSRDLMTRVCRIRLFVIAINTIKLSNLQRIEIFQTPGACLSYVWQHFHSQSLIQTQSNKHMFVHNSDRMHRKLIVHFKFVSDLISLTVRFYLNSQSHCGFVYLIMFNPFSFKSLTFQEDILLKGTRRQ